jgi:uncharacterized protein
VSTLSELEDYFAGKPPMAVAVSGGVDSMTLAVVAHRVNPETQIFHAISPAVPAQATDRVRHHAAIEGWQLNIIDAGEMSDPQYLANPANRCYFCKTNLYDAVVANTELSVASGTNMDDLGDYRPGLVAAEEHQVCHPYVDVGMDKATLRAVADELGLDDLKDLPAAPCLSSRVTTGIAIDANLLPVVNQVEEGLWRLLSGKLALEGVRCRIREHAVAIQIESHESFDSQASIFVQATQFVTDTFVQAGYPDQVAEILIEPYEKGSAFLIDTLNVN